MTTVGCALEAGASPRGYVSMGWLSWQGKGSQVTPLLTLPGWECSRFSRSHKLLHAYHKTHASFQKHAKLVFSLVSVLLLGRSVPLDCFLFLFIKFWSSTDSVLQPSLVFCSCNFTSVFVSVFPYLVSCSTFLKSNVGCENLWTFLIISLHLLVKQCAPVPGVLIFVSVKYFKLDKTAILKEGKT